MKNLNKKESIKYYFKMKNLNLSKYLKENIKNQRIKIIKIMTELDIYDFDTIEDEENGKNILHYICEFGDLNDFLFFSKKFNSKKLLKKKVFIEIN
jgi:hypothetical protein